ncbi:MAG: hydantoinase/oxoprolinase family protein [Beijerinckiaceae bacterium]|nr:hydantoinase/oxoprolinase family protein [Beijerinckiaceae bacterium]
MSIRIGIDVGGTFTDVTAFDMDAGEVALITKYDSDPQEPMRVMERITTDLEAKFGADHVSLILHGSTAALNTLLEDKGVKTGLIVNAGFRDVYEIGRQWRGEEVFNLFAPAPKMLLTRDLIYEVKGRLDYRGEVVEPLDTDAVARAARALAAAGAQSIGVCLLFSFTNPAHEREAAAIIRDVAPGVFVSLSSEVNPEWREYERTASTVANAYIGPPVARYLEQLEAISLKRFPACRTLMMKSDGGAGSARMLARTPIQTVMSGPVAGVIGARYLGDMKQIENLLTFDVGGTSSDMAVLPGAPQFRSEVSVGRHPIRTQTIDIDTIGAGGGSIASIELGGVLKVGPRSAGARPGPACYDRGGTQATLTDALVALGHLSFTTLLEGAMRIDGAKAVRAVQDNVAAPLGMSVRDAAWGVVTVLMTNCVSAMRTITVERGYDPREFTLIPFGGMGPTIAGRIARELGVRRILVPRDPGTFSAWGMLVTDVHQEKSLTRLTSIEDATPQSIEGLFADLEKEAIEELVVERFARDSINTLRYAGMRYRGQSYEVTIPAKSFSDSADLDALAEAFHDAHKRRYGHMAENEVVEIVNFKVVAVGPIAKPVLRPAPAGENKLPAPLETRRAWFGGDGECETPVWRRSSLGPGARIAGPAIIEEKTSTIVIYPGQSAIVDQYLNLEIEAPNAG